jgi:hypothetical protein
MIKMWKLSAFRVVATFSLRDIFSKTVEQHGVLSFHIGLWSRLLWAPDPFQFSFKEASQPCPCTHSRLKVGGRPGASPRAGWPTPGTTDEILTYYQKFHRGQSI